MVVHICVFYSVSVDARVCESVYVVTYSTLISLFRYWTGLSEQLRLNYSVLLRVDRSHTDTAASPQNIEEDKMTASFIV